MEDETLDTGPNNVAENLGVSADLVRSFPTPGGGAAFKNLTYPKSYPPGQDKIVIKQIKYVRKELIQTESSFQDPKEEIKGSVTLPMPNELSESNAVKWGESTLSNTAAALMPSLAKAVSTVAGGDGAGFFDSTKDFGTALTNPALANRLKTYMPVNIAAGLLKRANINVDPEAYISRATGSAINQNLELLFNGPTLRQFGFSFKMTPTSKEEAADIRRILNFFKKGMAPIRGKDQQSSFYLGAPNVFKIELKSASQLKSIGRIKTCALVACNINYTPDGFYAAYRDSQAGGSQPIAVTMSLGFTELTPIFSDEFGETGDTDIVGPYDYNYVSPDLPNVNTDNPRDPATARAQAAAEGRPLPSDVRRSNTPGATGRSAGTSADLNSGYGESGGY